MVSANVVEAVAAPEVPVIVIFEVPAVAVPAVVSVITVLYVVGLGEKVAVTPLGKPEAVNVTLPVKPYCPCTER